MEITTSDIRIRTYKHISTYRPILESTLITELGYDMCHTVMQWCDHITYNKKLFWEMYLVVTDAEEIIGITGLYSTEENSINRLWLGWFGIVPEYRKKGIGSYILDLTMERAVYVGCKEFCIYTNEVNTQARKLYLKHNFEELGTLQQNPHLFNMNDYYINANDIIFRKKI